MKFIELPSGKIISIENLLYVSEIKDVSVKYSDANYYQIDFMWTNKQTETLKYTNLETVNLDYNFLKNNLLNYGF